MAFGLSAVRKGRKKVFENARWSPALQIQVTNNKDRQLALAANLPVAEAVT